MNQSSARRPGSARRLCCAAVVAAIAGTGSLVRPALAADTPPALGRDAEVRLSAEQTRAFRAWMVRIIDGQITRGPTPRWQGRDCAGLVRFAVAEALRDHDVDWRRANGIAGRVPPDLPLGDEQKALRHNWRLADGGRSAYVGALELVQENTTFVSKDVNLAQPGDLLFFDQGDDQHLMVWTGWYVAYHRGTSDRRDNGLRAVSLKDLMAWRDTRWQPVADNPNFLGVYRLRFLSR